jgi:hypothetical protein
MMCFLAVIGVLALFHYKPNFVSDGGSATE